MSAADEWNALAKYAACMTESGLYTAEFPWWVQWAEPGGRLVASGESLDGIIELVIERYDFEDRNREMHVALTNAFKRASDLVYPRHGEHRFFQRHPHTLAQHYTHYVCWAELP